MGNPEVWLSLELMHCESCYSMGSSWTCLSPTAVHLCICCRDVLFWSCVPPRLCRFSWRVHRNYIRITSGWPQRPWNVLTWNVIWCAVSQPVFNSSFSVYSFSSDIQITEIWRTEDRADYKDDKLTGCSPSEMFVKWLESSHRFWRPGVWKKVGNMIQTRLNVICWSGWMVELCSQWKSAS